MFLVLGYRPSAVLLVNGHVPRIGSKKEGLEVWKSNGQCIIRHFSGVHALMRCFFHPHIIHAIHSWKSNFYQGPRFICLIEDIKCPDANYNANCKRHQCSHMVSIAWTATFIFVRKKKHHLIFALPRGPTNPKNPKITTLFPLKQNNLKEWKGLKWQKERTNRLTDHHRGPWVTLGKKQPANWAISAT